MRNYIEIIKTRRVILSFLLAVFLVLGGWFLFERYNQVLPQASIFFLNDVLVPAKDQKVLIFSPHPDDETIAAGGYIYDSVRAGAQVSVVLVTDGDKHGLKDKRYMEFRESAAILGVDQGKLIFLSYSDGKLREADKGQLKNQFRDIMDRVNPDILIYPHPLDRHQDHAVAGRVVEDVLNESVKEKIVSYQYLVHHYNFPQPKKYAMADYLLPPINMVNFDQEWQRHMLSSESEETKNRAVFSYRSQLGVPFLRSLILSSVRKNELFSVARRSNQ